MWHDAQGVVIYVGKAKNLKNRLSSYFSGKKDIKTSLLIKNASTIDYIVTQNEYEAFLLENTLIKRYSPKYNINLKDGKTYPLIKVTQEEYPRLLKTRTHTNDKATYYGPYPNAHAVDDFIKAIYKIYPIRHCVNLKARHSYCLYYHIGQCLGVCVNKSLSLLYTKYIGEIKQLLEENNSEAVINGLKERMLKAGREQNYETALRLRDGINALKLLKTPNIVESFSASDKESNKDYIAYYQKEMLITFTIIKVRANKVVDRYTAQSLSATSGYPLINEFLLSYYTDKSLLPPALFIQDVSYKVVLEEKEGKEVKEKKQEVQEVEEKKEVEEEAIKKELSFIKEFIHSTFGLSPSISIVREGIPNYLLHCSFIKMAAFNSYESMKKSVREEGDKEGLEELQRVLNLKEPPTYIEGFDIAELNGKFPVASLITFYQGLPNKKGYRYYKLKTLEGKIDDFKAMSEAATRRYTRLLNEGLPLPNLIMIDGGLGQVNAVYSILETLGLEIAIVGLAKKNEELYLPHTTSPIVLPKDNAGLRVLVRVRDETHRFATKQNQRMRSKENTVSVFTSIKGVGKVRACLIQKEFSTLENFCSQEVETIALRLKINMTMAEEIRAEAKKTLDKINKTLFTSE